MGEREFILELTLNLVRTLIKEMLLSKTSKPTSRGFSLIELLIVVAIISILVTLGASSWTSAQKKGRDTQRISDLRSIASELEKYYSDGNAYPNNSSGGSSFACADGTAVNWSSAAANFTCKASTSPTASTISYMKSVPTDPTGAAEYCYKSSAASNSQSYTLYTKLEIAPSSSDPNYHNGSADGGCNSSYNYKVTPLQ